MSRRVADHLLLSFGKAWDEISHLVHNSLQAHLEDVQLDFQNWSSKNHDRLLRLPWFLPFFFFFSMLLADVVDEATLLLVPLILLWLLGPVPLPLSDFPAEGMLDESEYFWANIDDVSPLPEWADSKELSVESGTAETSPLDSEVVESIEFSSIISVGVLSTSAFSEVYLSRQSLMLLAGMLLPASLPKFKPVLVISPEVINSTKPSWLAKA